MRRRLDLHGMLPPPVVCLWQVVVETIGGKDFFALVRPTAGFKRWVPILKFDHWMVWPMKKMASPGASGMECSANGAPGSFCSRCHSSGVTPVS